MEKLHAVTASEQVLHYEHGWTRVFLRRVAWGGGGGLRRVGKRFAGSGSTTDHSLARVIQAS